MTNETADERMKRLLTGQFNKQLPRRFYNVVAVSDQHGILLDGRPVKTPMKHPLVLPNVALANAVAQEWQAQDKVIDPSAMPLTKLANTALDRATHERVHVLDEIAQYAGSDLVCYWADRPPDLVELQRRHWQPVLDWAATTLGANLQVANGIQHVMQDERALNAIRAEAEKLDAWQLTAVYLVMTLTGSTLLALMLHAKVGAAEAIWSAAHVDEDYQISQWGWDAEAAERRAQRKREFDGLVRYLELISP